DRAGMVEQRLMHWSVANEEHEAARAIRESLPQSPRRDLALAQTWTAIGDCRYIGHDAKPSPKLRGTAEEAYQNALVVLRRVPPDTSIRRDALRELGRANQRLGGFYTGPVVHDLPRAIRHHEAALEALGELARLDPADAVARRNYADQFIMKATAHNRMGDGAGALEATTRGLEVLRSLAAADPKNVEAQHDLAFACSEQGVALMHLGRNAEAVAALREAIAIRERLIAADPANQEDVRDNKRDQRALDTLL
ncbi:MAG: hypothetical protein M3Q69_12310, partial [Acidobacteriota bacterium]|nr:hypothetical protein [Acidobacteriota bacterium]